MPLPSVVVPANAAPFSSAVRQRSVLPRFAAILLASLLMPAAQAADPQVQISTSLGNIVLELDEERAPQTVRNFLEYVDEGYYDNTLFHRVIEEFMIQGGGFDQQYEKKSTRSPISNEAYNGLRNDRYTIAMARTTAPHSATSQFFINSEDNHNLNHTDTSQRGWGYAVFGRVVDGKDVVDSISQVHTGPGGPFSRDVPAEPVVILNARRYKPVTNNGELHKDSIPDSATLQTSDLPITPGQQSGTAKPEQPIEQN